MVLSKNGIGMVVRNQGQGLLDSKIKFLSYFFGLRVFLSFNNLIVCMISDIDVILCRIESYSVYELEIRMVG